MPGRLGVHGPEDKRWLGRLGRTHTDSVHTHTAPTRARGRGHSRGRCRDAPSPLPGACGIADGRGIYPPPRMGPMPSGSIAGGDLPARGCEGGRGKEEGGHATRGRVETGPRAPHAARWDDQRVGRGGAAQASGGAWPERRACSSARTADRASAVDRPWRQSAMAGRPGRRDWRMRVSSAG
jgi:hypothetical protein